MQGVENVERLGGGGLEGYVPPSNNLPGIEQHERLKYRLKKFQSISTFALVLLCLKIVTGLTTDIFGNVPAFKDFSLDPPLCSSPIVGPLNPQPITVYLPITSQ